MTEHVFYSWQSDRPNSTNRRFIQTALEDATKRIRSDQSLEVEPVVDRDTVGLTGSPDISNTVFAKIDRAAVFVADITIIVARSKRHRATPNPNVLVELGYAAGKMGWNRIVLVMNTVFGPVEDLPFDLRQRRLIAFNRAEESEQKTDESKELSCRLEKALRAILQEPVPRRRAVSANVATEHPAQLAYKPQEITHPYYLWNVMVRERNTSNESGWSGASRYCTIRVFSDDLLHQAFQSADENAFLEKVLTAYPGDAASSLSDPDIRGVTVRNKGADLIFDRVWTWGGVGVLGMGTTLSIVGIPSLYSITDIARDAARFLNMAGQFLDKNPAEVWFELVAQDLAFVWRTAEAARISRLGEPTPESKPGINESAFVLKSFDSGLLIARHVAETVGELLQIAITTLHRERVERDRIAALVREP